VIPVTSLLISIDDVLEAFDIKHERSSSCAFTRTSLGDGGRRDPPVLHDEMSDAFTFQPGPVGQDFIDDRSFVKIICGPVGGGKSTDALMELFNRTIHQAPFDGVRRTKHVIMRNTTQQLKSTVKPLIDQWFTVLTKNRMGSWRVTDNVFEMKFRLPDKTIVHSEFALMAADTPDDVRRLLSLEASSAWIEEMREIDQAIFEGLQGRVARFPNRASGGVTYPGVIGSTNPPPMGSWLQE
jgi:hypothetical protein